MIEWRDKLEIDQGAIDEDHRNLIALINQFGTTRGSYRELLTIIQSLKHYARTHFEREELLLQEIGFPEIFAHQSQHLELVQRLDAMIEEFVGIENGDYRALQVKLALVLRDWLVDHIVGEDRKMRPLLQEREERMRVPNGSPRLRS